MTTGRIASIAKPFCCNLAALLFALSTASIFAAPKKEETHYPNATRSAPKSDLSNTSEQKSLQEGLDALNGGDDAKAQEMLQKVVDSAKSKYAKGIAMEGLANVKFNESEYPAAITLYKQLLELNSVSNDAYFDSMYNLANAYVASEQYQAALDQLKIWREQGKRETADSYALEGNIYYRLQKFPEAIAAIKKAQSMTDQPKDSWNSILMASLAESGQSGEASSVIEQQMQKDPKNKQLVHNALVIYVQNNQNDKALALLDRQHKDGLITDENDYTSAARFYANIGQTGDNPSVAAKGAELLQEGLNKNVVKPTAENYKLQGDLYMVAQDQNKALAAYEKASPLASNGDIDYMRAQIVGAQQNWPEAKTLADKAISRGVTHKGKAYLLLGKLDTALKDNAGAKAAFQKAQADAETSSDAAEQLRKLDGKKK